MTDTPRIAVVDDDDAVRDALGNLLAALGYRVKLYASASDFIEDQALGRVACLITDMQMPGISGLELIEHLARTGSAIPVIVITAHSMPALESRARRNGAVAWLEKPLRQDQLMESLARAIG